MFKLDMKSDNNADTEAWKLTILIIMFLEYVCGQRF